MISFKKILVPVDFSEPSRKAVTYGRTLAAQLNSQLTIAHIVPESSALVYAFPTETSRIEKEQYDRAMREIGDLIPKADTAKLNLQTIVKIGVVEDELLQIVKDEAVDLVVMGTHGRRALGRWFLGSVTEHILRKIHVPVLTASHLDAKPHKIELISWKRILYATDLSEASNRGFNVAIELARRTGAAVTVVHVVDDEDRMLWGPAVLSYLDRDKLVQERQKKMDELVARQDAAGVELETLVVDGKPFRRIIEIAEERSADIIALNLQSKSLLERAILGATAERVVRLAHTPVLSVPAATP